MSGIFNTFESAPAALPANKPGIHFTPLAEMNVPPKIKSDMEKELALFLKTGSTSGGMATNEFTAGEDLAKNLKKEGLEKIKTSLAIIPSDLCLLAGDGFILHGADSQAKLVSDPNKGWAGFLQICKQVDGPALLELSEKQLEVDFGDSHTVPAEYVNAKVLNAPASFELVKTKDAVSILNLHWAQKIRVFTLVTKHVSTSFHQQLAERVSQAYLTMPNDGWKKAYQTPAHRLPPDFNQEERVSE